MLFRTYCNVCKDFTLFTEKQLCTKCNSFYTTVYLHKIPKELQEAQKERIKKATMKKINGVMSAVTPHPKEIIIEVEIPKAIPEKAQDSKDLRIYYGVGRNSPCPCGSNQKYKKCCLRSVNQLKKKHGI